MIHRFIVFYENLNKEGVMVGKGWSEYTSNINTTSLIDIQKYIASQSNCDRVVITSLTILEKIC